MAEQETKTLITWTEGKYSGLNGVAGGIHLFTVNWKTQHSKPNWSLRTDLPGFAGKVWESDDRDELYRKAEKVLAAWLARVSQADREA